MMAKIESQSVLDAVDRLSVLVDKVMGDSDNELVKTYKDGYHNALQSMKNEVMLLECGEVLKSKLGGADDDRS